MFYKLKPGSGPTHIFLHGFLGDHRDWDPIISELPFPCIAFDLPGHGQTPFTADFLTSFFKDTFHFAPFHLIGYSMGGRLAGQFREMYPEKIAQITLLSTHLGLTHDDERKQRLEKDRKLAKRILEIPIDEFLKEWYDQPLFRTLVSKMDIRSMRTRQDREGLSKALVAFSLGKQKRLHLNANFFIGEHDPLYRGHYQHIPHTLIADAGHAVHLENPKEIIKRLYELSM